MAFAPWELAGLGRGAEIGLSRLIRSSFLNFEYLFSPRFLASRFSETTFIPRRLDPVGTFATRGLGTGLSRCPGVGTSGPCTGLSRYSGGAIGSGALADLPRYFGAGGTIGTAGGGRVGLLGGVRSSMAIN